jgi:hypothetical protein
MVTHSNNEPYRYLIEIMLGKVFIVFAYYNITKNAHAESNKLLLRTTLFIQRELSDPVK